MTAGFFQDADPAKLRQIVDLNVHAVVDLTRRFLPGMIARRPAAACSMSPPSRASCRCPIRRLTPPPRPSCSPSPARSPMRPWARRAGLGARAGRHRHGAARQSWRRALPLCHAPSGDDAEDLARIAYRQFKRGKKLIVTGWFNRLSLFARRFAPDFALVPFMGWLFRVRDAEGNLQLPGVPKPADTRVPDKPASGDGPQPPAA